MHQRCSWGQRTLVHPLGRCSKCMIRNVLYITVCPKSCIAANCQQLLTWKDSVRTLTYARNVERIEKAVLKRESWGMVNVRRSFRLGQHFVRMASEQLLRHWEHFDTGGGASSSISSRASTAMINNHTNTTCLHSATICNMMAIVARLRLSNANSLVRTVVCLLKMYVHASQSS